MWTLLPLLALLLACQAPSTISPGAPEAEKSQGLTLVLYDVRDIAAKMPPEFGAPELGLSTTRPEQGAAVPAEPCVGLPAGFEEVVEVEPTPEQLERGSRIVERLVRTYLDPPLSGAGEEIRRAESGTLVVNARPQQQAWLQRFLDGLRSFDGVIELQARIYTAPRGVLREWELAPSSTLATPGELAAFQERVRADGRFEVVTAPKLTQFACNRANISVVNQVAYVKGWQVLLVEPGGQEIADPEVAVVSEGVVVDARTTPLPGERFGLQLELASCELERPIPTRKLRISASSDQQVEIGEPQVKTVRFAATVVLADGASAVLVTADTDAEKDLAVVVTVRRAKGPGESRDK